ncbi:MAG: glycosyltransferase [Candidatus Bathyarchaeia archaeon]
MEKPRVTIGMCVRNCENTVKDAIESILKQDYPHELIEIIFVDDGSEDGTLSVIKEYVPKIEMKVKVLHHKWKGLGYSRNIVLKNSSGKYIVWVDGDLILEPNYVRTMVEFMENNHRVAIAGGSYGLLNQANLVAFLDNVEYVAYRYRTGTNLPGTGGAIYRVNAIKQIGGFDESIKGSCEDIDVAYRTIKAGWSVVRDKAFFYARGKKTWKEYWVHSIWHGYGAHFIKHKNKGVFSISKMCPPIALLGGIIYSVTAYKILQQKSAFLLPIYVIFKNFAWWIGFIKSHITGYGHC